VKKEKEFRQWFIGYVVPFGLLVFGLPGLHKFPAISQQPTIWFFDFRLNAETREGCGLRPPKPFLRLPFCL
jgi:hypothetical protein